MSKPVNATDIRRYHASYAHKEWANIDFTTISEALEIEINRAMSPPIVQSVIEGRFDEMSVAEFNKIPENVLLSLSSLKTLGKFEITHQRTTQTNHLHPFRLVKESKHTVSLSPIVATLSRFSELIDTNIGLNTFLAEYGGTVKFLDDRVQITCIDFYPWTEKNLTDIFKSFDAYAED